MTQYYAALTGEALLHLSGPDALTFLQGQTTCDTRLVDDSSAVAGVYCTPQGRVVCDFLLVQLGHEHVALRLRRDIRAHAAQVFGKYVVFSKARFDADNDDWQCLALWGPDVAQSIRHCFGDAPQGLYAQVSGEGFVVLQTNAEGTQFECYLQADSAHRQALEQTMSQADESEWRRQQINAGIVRIESSTQETLVPQVANYDLTGHISFSKGCYTGQEVVARLHYRGTSKRRTYLAQLPQAAQTGDSVYVQDSEQSVGDIVNVDNSPPCLALVSATRTGAAQGLRLGAPDGPPIELLPLPYSLDDEKA
ncbi:MAG: hypothetical protein NXI15_01905 [Gammaproteobacteria bacterium]|nr:hypothetical protein [Gammaproteobacteria bacterium]